VFRNELATVGAPDLDALQSAEPPARIGRGGRCEQLAEIYQGAPPFTDLQPFVLLELNVHARQPPTRDLTNTLGIVSPPIRFNPLPFDADPAWNPEIICLH